MFSEVQFASLVSLPPRLTENLSVSFLHRRKLFGAVHSGLCLALEMKGLISCSESRCLCSALLLLAIKSENRTKLNPSLRPAREDSLIIVSCPQSETAKTGKNYHLRELQSLTAASLFISVLHLPWRLNTDVLLKHIKASLKPKQLANG